MAGKVTKHVVLEVEHLEIVQYNLRQQTIEKRIAERSRILLLRSEGVGPTEVAAMVGCGRATVYRVCDRYGERGLGALDDLPRSGRPPKFSPPAARSNHCACVRSPGGERASSSPVVGS